MKIIITNGPPRSGKDTMCGLILENIIDHDLIPLSYKRTLYVGVARRYGLSVDAVFQMNADTLIKDEPSSLFGGKSVRQALIFESEEVIKKKYGEQGVAIETFKLLQEEYGTERLKHAVLYCSDGGFNSELFAAYEHFGIGVEDVYILRMLREGCSFAGDSREFLKNPDVVIHNNSDIDHLRSYLPRIQRFCDGFTSTTSHAVHTRRLSDIRWHNFYKEMGITNLLQKVKRKKIAKPIVDRNKKTGLSNTLKRLLNNINI